MITLTDIADHICGGGATIHQVMSRINRTPYLFQVVVDDAGGFLGTVTDGDIRRAMLAAKTLDAPIADCMRTDAVVGRIGDDDGNVAKLFAIRTTVPFLPVLDEAGKVLSVLVAADPPSGCRTALIMAGGLGRRLGEHTKATPKPLVKVGDKPILQHVLEHAEAAGVRDAYVSVHHMAEQIEAFVAGRNGGARVHLVHEDEPLGTAGAIGKLPEAPKDPLLVLNGDVLTQVDLIALLAFHRRHNHDATIAVALHEEEIPFGVIRHNEDGLFLGIEEKPVIRHHVAAGIYCLAPEICALVPRDAAMDMPELLNMARGAGLRVGLFPIHEYWRDIGRPDDLESAQNDHGRRHGAEQ